MLPIQSTHFECVCLQFRYVIVNYLFDEPQTTEYQAADTAKVLLVLRNGWIWILQHFKDLCNPWMRGFSWKIIDMEYLGFESVR